MIRLILDDEEFASYTYVPSNKAYEMYRPTDDSILREGSIHVVNVSYVFVGARLDITRQLEELVKGLLRTTPHVKIEGCEVGEGELILQDRMEPRFTLREDGKLDLWWRGCVSRLPPGYKVITDSEPLQFTDTNGDTHIVTGSTDPRGVFGKR